MPKSNKIIQVFEFDKLKVGRNSNQISSADFKVLENHFGDKGVPYYTLIHNGVRFNNYVGVLQINNITIEVLPKIDKLESDVEWRKILIQLLHFTGEINVDTTEFSNLKTSKLSLLELYFSIFIKECNYLLHSGLVKKYRKNEANLFALKGNLMFSENISKNIIHKERFYTKHTIYDNQHLLHQVLLEAMLVIRKVSNSGEIQNSISKLLLNFPEQKKLNVNDATFNKIAFSRKTEPYKKAINIAKMILLNYYPDVNKGNNSVLALFFDMNLLWEKYVAKVLKKYLDKTYEIKTQNRQLFWQSNVVANANIKPDIIIKKENETIAIIDTKWKLPLDYRPADEDLKQMFSYNNRFECSQSWLLYPNNETLKKEGNFFNNYGNCGMLLTQILFDKKLNHNEYFKSLVEQIHLNYSTVISR